MRQRARSLTPSLEWNCQTASDILRDVRDSIEIARMKGKCSYCVLSVSVVQLLCAVRVRSALLCAVRVRSASVCAVRVHSVLLSRQLV